MFVRAAIVEQGWTPTTFVALPYYNMQISGREIQILLKFKFSRKKARDESKALFSFSVRDVSQRRNGGPAGFIAQKLV
jgi:hypothetical protein